MKKVMTEQEIEDRVIELYDISKMQGLTISQEIELKELNYQIKKITSKHWNSIMNKI